MPFKNEASQEHPRPLGRLKLSTVVILSLAVGVVIVAIVGAYFRFHLLWLYMASSPEFRDVQAIRDDPMPDSPTPDGWVQVRVGTIEFSLPPELADARIPNENGSSLVLFELDSLRLIVALPTDGSEVSSILQVASHIDPQSRRFTLPQLIRVCYQTSSDEFNWSMTPAEVRWLMFRIEWSNLIRVGPDGYTETMDHSDVEGIIHYLSEERAYFDWAMKTQALGGYMHFIDRGESLDPTLIRAIGQSLTLADKADGN